MRRRLLMPALLVGVAALVGVGVVLLASTGSSSSDDYEAAVIQSRDRADLALSRIPQAQSPEDYVDRLEIAGTVITVEANKLDRTRVPEQFADETKRLVRNLRQLGAALRGTAGEARDIGFRRFLGGAKGLNFESWDRANAVLSDLRKQGIDVQPLGRH